MSRSFVRRAGLAIACLLAAQDLAAQGALQILKEFDGPLIGPSGGILRTPDGMLFGAASTGGRYGYGGIYRLQGDGAGFTVLHHFDTLESNGSTTLIQGADGFLYGTTPGGRNGVGMIFKLRTDGTAFTVLHEFARSDGAYPYAGLVQDVGGTLYGAASQGGSSGKGTVYKLQPDGTGFNTLHTFTGVNGATPYAALLLLAGKLHGVTYEGGTSNLGTIFSLNTEGSGFATLHSFVLAEGIKPGSSLIQATNGALYGTTAQGGGAGLGTIFEIQTNGAGFAVRLSLGPANGAPGGIIQGLDGALYGVGRSCCQGGTIYRVQTNGSNLVTLHTLTPSEGSGPVGRLVQAPDGTLFGVTESGGTSNSGAVFKSAPDGGQFATIHSIQDESGEGTRHFDALVLGSDDRLRGVTVGGGPSGAGVMFGVGIDGGGFAALHSLDPAQGKASYGGLLQGLDGSLYGTTQAGGPFAAGTVFKVEEDGTDYTVLRSFNGSDASQPQAALTQGSDGTLYGTALFGGVFKIQPDGSGFQALGGMGDYQEPGVTLGPDDFLYGATTFGGANGEGVLFRMKTDGSELTELHSFSGTDGTSPTAVIFGSDGMLYGATGFGGNVNNGTIFRMRADGTGFTTLRFLGGLDGGSPRASLLELPDGSLVGTTYGDNGTLFQMKKDGSAFEVLHRFSGSDGAVPWARVITDSKALYGTTYRGGPRGGGVVYKFNLPTVTAPTSANAGGQIVADVAHAPGHATDWIGLYREGTSDGQLLDWKYLNGARTAPAQSMATAAVSFWMPSTPGTYHLRLYSNNTYWRRATSNPIVVSAAVTPTLQVSSTSVSTGSQVQVTVQGGPGNTSDWLGLYATTATDTAYLDWRYLNGLKTPPAAGLSSATVGFSLPATPGTYEFRLFRGGTYLRLATSPVVSAVAAPAPTVSLSATTASPGATIQVTVQNGPGLSTDWLGLHPASAGDRTYIDWRYLNGQRTPPSQGLATATIPFRMPMAPGTYNVRLFLANGFTRLATSLDIVVQ